jgi:uncharacterized membrane protein YgcG
MAKAWIPKDFVLQMDSFIDDNALDTIINNVGDFCTAACAILFICIMIKFVKSLLNEGYSINLLKRMLLQMAILGAIVSPLIYPLIAGIYRDIFRAFMDNIGNSELKNLRQAMWDYYNSCFKDGEIGVKKLFGIIEIQTSPIEVLVATAAYILFIISMYEVMAIPNLFACLTICVTPILIAASPLFEDMIGKVATLLVGFAVIFPLILFGLQLFLCPMLTLITDLLMKENMTLLLIYSLTFSLFIPLVLQIFSYISGLSFVESLTLAFPIAWIMYFIVTPVKKLINLSLEKNDKKGSKANNTPSASNGGNVGSGGSTASNSGGSSGSAASNSGNGSGATAAAGSTA